MTRTIRMGYPAVALLMLSFTLVASATAQTAPYNYGYCMGTAGAPPSNYVTRTFLLGPTSVDWQALFMRDLAAKYGGNLRRDATGCRMFATAAEAAKAHAELMGYAGRMPFPLVSIDWLPAGAKPLSAAAPAKAAKSDTARKPQ